MSEVGSLKKPQLRGLLQSQIKKNLIIGISLALVSGVLFKTLVCDKRKKAYAEFYRTYDIEKEFNIMRNKGLFDSCEADP